jgi:hypothetical protein
VVNSSAMVKLTQVDQAGVQGEQGEAPGLAQG